MNTFGNFTKGKKINIKVRTDLPPGVSDYLASKLSFAFWPSYQCF